MAKKVAQRKPRKTVAKAAPRAKPKPRKKTMTDKHADKHADTKTVTPATTTAPLPPEEMLTEQEQDVYAGGGNGVGPMPASVESVPVETMEAQGIGPRDPYPSAPPPPINEIDPPPETRSKKGK